MDPVIGAALISAGGGLLKQRADKASSARQMAFQERMSNTAHQRQMQDLKKAGINPMLSAKLGGASTPSGSQYQATNIGAEAVKGGLAGAQTTTAKQQATMATIDAKAAQAAGLSPQYWTTTARNAFLGSKFGMKATSAVSPYADIKRTTSARGLRGLSLKEKRAVLETKNKREAKKFRLIKRLGDATLHGTYKDYKFYPKGK
jgi:hypothetical protein